MKGRERSRWIVAAGLLLFYPLARSRIPPRAVRASKPVRYFSYASRQLFESAVR